MEELTSIRKLKWEMKKKQIQETTAQKVHQVSDWCKRNQEILAVAIPATAVGLKSASRMIGNFARRSAVKHEERDKKTRFYDHSLGCYWYTRRELRSDELLSVTKRRAAGESYGDIFKSMHLLK